MRISRSEATKRCEYLDDSCYPPVAYKGSRLTPIGAIYETYTVLESELLQVLQNIAEKAQINSGGLSTSVFVISPQMMDEVKLAIKEVCDNE